MENRYLLYIDLLGFSEIADQPLVVQRLYEIIDSLAVHRDADFEVIVFSDTILVYNKQEPVSMFERSMTVMFLCEFAQDLFYRLIGQDTYFRAYITYGQFEHKRLKNVDSFYGPALVHAYRRSNDIQCIGLFIENSLVRYSDVFEVSSYDDDCHYVALTQRLRNICFDLSQYPLTEEYVVESDLVYLVNYDLVFLRNIYAGISKAGYPERVRRKYVNTWRALKRLYPGLLQVLERAEFNFRAVAATDWSEPISRVGTDRGFHG